MLKQRELRAICEKFIMYGDFMVGVPFGTGHINDTYQITCDQGGVRLHYILQRINPNVFANPHKVMENVDRVTAHLLEKFRATNRNMKRRTLRLLRTYTNIPYVFDENGDCYRSYVFVENARSYDVLDGAEMAFSVARAFGEFQCDLIDLPGPRLHETIPNFHNTPQRIVNLEKAVEQDPCGRVKDVGAEIEFVLQRRDDANLLIRLNADGDIPERITHNDTKVNNLLIDDFSGEGVCVLDLDTVMPGLVLYDFGDMVRTGTSTAEEDEVDLRKVEMDFPMFEAIMRGYLSSAGGFLTPAEKEFMPFSGELITLEIGTRFLTDYINGDTYFKIKRPTHNLERARNQFKLVTSIESQMDAMRQLLKTL
ncbi:MAG: aminoglycoside phosphotransferase family protein [Victivallaceae bacterium]|nr:aminoglycoside phosphotransferase family protein [Victivallaceae bacterium]